MDDQGGVAGGFALRKRRDGLTDEVPTASLEALRA